MLKNIFHYKLKERRQIKRETNALATRHDTGTDAKHTLLACLLAAFSLYLVRFAYVTVSNLLARRQPHSVFGAIVHAGTICLFLGP